MKGFVFGKEASWFDVLTAVLLKIQIFWGPQTRRGDFPGNLKVRHETVQRPYIVVQYSTCNVNSVLIPTVNTHSRIVPPHCCNKADTAVVIWQKLPCSIRSCCRPWYTARLRIFSAFTMRFRYTSWRSHISVTLSNMHTRNSSLTSVPPAKFQNIALSQATAISFHIISNSEFKAVLLSCATCL